MSAHQVHQVIEVVLADVVAGKQHLGATARLVGSEVVAQGLDNGLGAQVTATDADGDDILTLLAQHGSGLLDAGELLLVDAAGQVKPAQEVVAGTRAAFERLLGGEGSIAQVLCLQPLKGVFADDLNLVVHVALFVFF